MAELLKGKAVADSISEKTKEKVDGLKNVGITPTLAIMRLGENPGDVFYEKGAVKRAGEVGIDVKKFIYDENISQEKLIEEIDKINNDDSIHGVLLFRPLPKHIDDQTVCEALAPAKDMDGITSGSMAGVFTASGEGYPPCTAQACIEILKYYGIELSGKKVTVMGRSLVIGRPVAMMAMHENATVTVCHSRTSKEDFAAAGRNAEIVIAALGRAKMIDDSVLGKGQTLIDVGINTDENGKMCGDIDFEKAEREAAAITPVPGGVGSVTTAILMQHVAEAASKVR